MIKNFLLITLRSMMKHKVYLFINILGMAISVGCCITAYYNYDFNASFDEYHVNRSSLYRVNMIRDFQNQKTAYGLVPIPLGEAARQNVKDIETSTRYSSSYADFRIGDEIFDTGISYIDPEFFNMFTIEFIEGNGNVLHERTNVVISDEMAIRFFGTTNAVGKELTHVMEGNTLRQFTVAGVFKLPPTNSSFNDGAYVNYENYWEVEPEFNQGTNWVYRNTFFVKVDNPSRIPAIEQQLKPYAENNNKVREDFVLTGFALDPFVGMAVRDEYTDRPGTWTRDASPLAAVAGTGIMSIFLLLIACFNLTNTSIAMSSRRLKEIGIRKVMGSMRNQLVLQFIGETMVVCFVALLLGMAIADLFLVPAFNSLWPYMKLTTNYFGNYEFTLVMVSTLLFTGLLAGSYPAFYISKFQPTTILKGKLKFGGTNYFTRVLLSLQFAISLIGIVCSLAFIDNAKYQQSIDMGFKQKEVLFTWVNNEAEYNALRDAMSQHPDVVSVAGSEHHIFSSVYNDPVKHESKEIETDIMHVGDQYLTTAGFTLVQGRDFVKDSETDRKESVIVTQKFASQFGWNNPIGKELIWLDTVKLYVIGVVRDVYTDGLWNQYDPMMIRYCAPEKYKHLLVTGPADKMVGVRDFMEKKWKEVFPNRKFASRFMDDQTAEAANVNNNIVKMFIFLGVVAVLLSVTGLFTLVSLNIVKKMKEIGVRKVLGASISNISKVINAEFAIILIIACVLGAMGGSFMAEMLMDSIWDFYQQATWITLTVSSIIILLASALTVGFKTYNTARLNPAHVLRDE